MIRVLPFILLFSLCFFHCLGVEPPCRSSSDCQVHEVCVAGLCKAGICKNDSHCKDNEVCQDGKCQPKKAPNCERSSDCKSSEICISGECQPLPCPSFCSTNNDCVNCSEGEKHCVKASGQTQGRCGAAPSCPSSCQTDQDCTGCPANRKICISGSCSQS